ncbi:ATP-binding protein [Pasteurellaceae bacterium LFhippo2]|nr:ATP-binding protein [Pasteurellaceae bacterium LFhippo2]
MSILTLILGESGTGKSTSLRHFDPKNTLLIQSIHKPLPFRPKGWGLLNKQNPEGNIFVTDNSAKVCEIMAKTQREIIVIDDFQYIMANEYMRRAKETGFQKFTDIGRGAWDIFDLATKLAPNKRVYILAHTQNDDFGRTKIKTIGKMLDEKITLEGMVTICLRTQVADGKYQFSTQNNGSDTTKSPMGLFEQQLIDNDLNAVDSAICDYYGISKPQEQANE